MHRLTFRAVVGAALFSGAVSSCAAQVPWEPLGRSAEGRVIEFVQLGQGEHNVLVVGGMAGDDIQGVGLAEKLASHLARFPTWLAGLKVTIVRDPNPDGRARRTAANARGVEIDRNFHTRRWRKVSENNRLISGREPESEPETRLLADLLADLKPQRIIVLSSSPLQASLGACGPAENWAQQVGTQLRCAPQPIDPIMAPGSLAVLAGNDLEIATVVLRLPPGKEIERAWSDYKRAALAAVGAGPKGDAAVPVGRSPPAFPNSGEFGDATPSATTESPPVAVSRPSEKDSQRKVLTYEELAGGSAMVPVVGRREVAPTRLAPRVDTENQPSTATETRATESRATERPAITPARLERLPRIDRTRPTVRPRHQEPIPFYPETGI